MPKILSGTSWEICCFGYQGNALLLPDKAIILKTWTLYHNGRPGKNETGRLGLQPGTVPSAFKYLSFKALSRNEH